MRKRIATFVTLEKIALQLYSVFKQEAKRKSTFFALSKPEKRVIHALGLTRRTFRRWTRKGEERFGTRESEKLKRGRKPKIDSFDKDLLHRIISKYLQESEVVTLRKLRQKLARDHDISVSKVTLWKYVKKLGFTFKKLKGGRNLLCETSHIVSLRAKYLRKLKELRDDGYEIYFLDESYINEHHVFEKEWQSVDIKRNVPSGKGRRLIIAHCGSSDKGLIPNGALIFKSKSNDEHGDYHKDMDSVEFNKWIKNKVVPSFTKKSCLVMDNAAYHNVTDDEDKIPTRKNDIREWLSRSNVPFTNTMLRPELLQLAKAHKHTKSFHIDKYLKSQGHVALRLPPYHPQLNPIELVWAEIKRLVALRNTTFKLKDIEILTREAISSIDKEFWNKCENHVHKIEEDYWKKEGLHIIQPPAIINVFESSDSE